MSSTDFEEYNLSSMLEIVAHNLKAQMLARSLWEFYERKLICRRPSIDQDRPNSVHIDVPKFMVSRGAGDLQPEVVIRRNFRQEAGLIHELLHLNLIPLGFPKFRIWEDEDNDDAWALAEMITNNAEHVPMLPVFVSLGYCETEFLAPFARKTSRATRVVSDMAKLQSLLLKPDTFAPTVSSYLTQWSIRHDIVWISKILADQTSYYSPI